MTSAQQQILSDVEYRIDLQAIKNNIQILRASLGSKVRIMAMVKALAYGTDDVILAHFLSTCEIDILGVATLEEGVTLKEKCSQQNIFVINIMPDQVFEAVSKRLEIGAGSEEIIEALGKTAENLGIIVKVHLHIDTGMTRFGCRPEDAQKLAETIKRHRYLSLEGILSHFSCSDDPEQDSFTQKQIDLFSSTIFTLQSKGIYANWYHIANSTGIIRFSIPLCNMVRVGLAIYGIPNSTEMAQGFPFLPALSLKTRISAINFCKKGDSVSYNRTYQISQDHAKIGVLPLGYFDGLHRCYSNKIEVLVRGRKAPLVGTICMDHVMVDLTHIPEACIGDIVTIFGTDEWGNTISPVEIAERGGTIVHELITCLGPRIKRVFV